MGLGTFTSYARAKSIFKIQMFILIHFTNLAAQNAAKQRMAKYHPQKSHSNNARSVVKSLPPLNFITKSVLIPQLARSVTVKLKDKNVVTVILASLQLTPDKLEPSREIEKGSSYSEFELSGDDRN